MTSKTLKSLEFNGVSVTPAGDPSIPLDVFSYEGKRNLDGSAEFRYVPSDETATFPVSLDQQAIKTIRAAMRLPGSLEVIAHFRDGSAVILGSSGIQNNPPLDGEGAVEVEVFPGRIQWV
jgi:hypothetical protein